MRQLVRSAALAAAVGVTLAAFAGQSSASSAKGPAPQPRKAAAARALPAGYQLVTSGEQPVTGGTQGSAEATCPSGTIAISGGEYSSASTFGVSINTLFPDGTLPWIGYVNNADATDSTTNVYATCIASSYTVTSTPFHGTNTPNSHLHLQATCPTGSVVVGGGEINDDLGLGERMVSSYPVKSGSGASLAYGWAVDMNNTYKTGNLAITIIAYCTPTGSIKGCHLYKGSTVSGDPLTQVNAQIQCPFPKQPLSGGVRTLGTSVKLSLNSTYPFGNSWGSYVNNPTLKIAKLVPYAVCAGI